MNNTATTAKVTIRQTDQDIVETISYDPTIKHDKFTQANELLDTHNVQRFYAWQETRGGDLYAMFGTWD